MSWRLVAREQVASAIRARELHSYVGFFALLFGVMAYLYTRQAEANEPEALIGGLSVVTTVIVPATALMLAYDAIVKPRSDGQLSLLLGLPHDRRDVVVGTLVGQSLVFLSTLVGGVAAAAAIVVLFRASLAVVALGAFLLATGALAVAYVAMAIAISATVRDQTRASVAAFGAFLTFIGLWTFVPDAVLYVVSGMEPPATEPRWTDYLSVLSPTVAHRELLAPYLDGEFDAPLAAVSAVVLLGWTILAPAYGYRRFRRSDL